MNECRVCHSEFFTEPLLRYENMPGVAQNLPDKDSLEFDKGVDLNIYQCSGCGLVQLANEPVYYFREVIRAISISLEMKLFRENQFNSFIRKYLIKNKKIVEIGCGKGDYLSIMNKLDVSAYGLEYNKKSAEYCNILGLNVQQGFVDSEKYVINNGPFSAFYMLSFLEHLPDPNSTLRGIYNNLVDEGLGIVEVPNFDMICEKIMFAEFTSDHLCYFTKETLSYLLNINGFDVIECESIWHNYILSAVVKKKKALDVSQFNIMHTMIEKEVNSYISCFSDKRIAIWGAGHQSLAIIAMLKLDDKIKFVVDSAKFKQGKFTPVTHIPIVSPQILHEGLVDAVIIIAGSYSDEVLRILKNELRCNMSIAILRDYGLEIVLEHERGIIYDE